MWHQGIRCNSKHCSDGDSAMGHHNGHLFHEGHNVKRAGGKEKDEALCICSGFLLAVKPAGLCFAIVILQWGHLVSGCASGCVSGCVSFSGCVSDSDCVCGCVIL